MGVDHPLTLGVMLSLADTYAALGRFADALWLYSAVHSHFAREHGDTHPQTLAVGDRFAAGCVAAGHFARAEHLYTTHLAALEAASADAHGGEEEEEAEEDPAVAPLLAALAEVYVSQGKYAAAEPLLQVRSIPLPLSPPPLPDATLSPLPVLLCGVAGGLGLAKAAGRGQSPGHVPSPARAGQPVRRRGALGRRERAVGGETPQIHALFRSHSTGILGCFVIV